jgi:hypothetical protein
VRLHGEPRREPDPGRSEPVDPSKKKLENRDAARAGDVATLRRAQYLSRAASA